MSLQEPIDFACPFCDATQNRLIWTSVNSTIDPEAAEEVYKQTLWDHTCSACGRMVKAVHDMLFHDMHRQVMIALGESIATPLPANLPEKHRLPESYRLRLTVRLYDFTEKARLMSQVGYDDRLFELMKAHLQLRDPMQHLPPDGEAWFDHVQEKPGAFVYFSQRGHEPVKRIEVPLQSIMESQRPYKRKLDRLMHEYATHVNGWWRIDSAWARMVVQAMND